MTTNRLTQHELRLRQKAEADALNQAVMETVALDAQRGAEFHAPKADRGGKAKPVRRLTGLEWMASKGKLTADQKAAGERYGAIYRAAQADPSIRSNLNQSPGGAGAGASSMTRHLNQAERRVRAADKLRELRAILAFQADLIDALDLIAGQELTPRQAAANGAQAMTLEALVTVALDLLVTWEDGQ